MKNESLKSEYLKSEIILAIREVWSFFLLSTCSVQSHFIQPPAAY